jgi:hypothetical protein
VNQTEQGRLAELPVAETKPASRMSNFPYLSSKDRSGKMSTLGIVLLVVLVLALLGAAPTWGYSSGWGYGPSGGIGLVLLVVVVLLLTGTI